MMTTDEQLGSATAFAALVARHRAAVYAIAGNMCATPRDAEEVLRQSFLAAWRDFRFLPPGASVSRWLYRIALETALAHRQTQRSDPAGSLEAFLPRFDGAGRPARGRGRAFESGGSFEVSGLLREALEFVDDLPRAAFVLRDLLELPAEEAAAILEIPVPEVRASVHRVRLMLRGFLDQL